MQAQPRLEETARSLGLSWRRPCAACVLPLAGPGLGAAATMVFISVVTELNSTLLLSPIDTQTLATQVWTDTSTMAFAAAAPYAALLVGISLFASASLFALLGKSAVTRRTQLNVATPFARLIHRIFMSELRISGLQKSFDGQPVLHGIDLSVERGTLLALLGPSGSGKTTLAARALRLRTRGWRQRRDRRARASPATDLHVPSEQRRIGYVPQEGALFPHLSVADNIVFGLPRTQRRARSSCG